ncbi:YhhN-like protein [Flavobacterium terrigena]|uniref:YhhN-like protein n=1 Tax=Flavobacterium terrigena TaxID=402734 RepID=A0A1H6S9I6_9FLAO|nr:hypothetical protein SAMN05660918_1225 [Flavobacterium terrigena]
MIYIISLTILYGLFPFLVFLFNRNKIANNANAILPFVLLVFFSAIYEFVFTVLLRWDVGNWYLTYCVVSFLTLFYFYKEILSNAKSKLKITSFIFFLIILFYLFYRFDVQDFLKICYNIDTYITVFIFIFSIIWFRKIFRELEYESLWDIPYFYVVSGLILYYFGNFFLFLMTELIYKNDSNLFQYYWLLNVVLNLVLRTLLIVGIWKARVR